MDFMSGFFPVEALHLGTLMAAHGYFFPISDHVLTLKDDGTFYRFQVRIVIVMLWFLFVLKDLIKSLLVSIIISSSTITVMFKIDLL